MATSAKPAAVDVAAPAATAAAAPASASGSPNTADAVAAKLEGKELVSALTAQLDFYFSPQNLARDVHLLQLMNPQKFVSLDVIASFKRVKQLTTDRTVLVDALKSAKNCVADDAANPTMVRPQFAAVKMERTTLVLREIAPTVAAADIRAALFDSDASPAKGKVSSLRPEAGDTWFVTLDSAETCRKTALFLMSQQFQGKPVRCFVKSENLVHGLQSAPTTAQQISANANANANAVAGSGMITTPLGPNGYYMQGGYQPNGQYFYNPNAYYGQQPYNGTPAKGAGQAQAAGQAANATPGRGKNKKQRNQQQPQPQPQPQPQLSGPTPAQAAAQAASQRREGAQAAGKGKNTRSKPQTPLTSAAPAPQTDGTRKATHQYSKSEMHATVTALIKSGDVAKPTSFPAGSVIVRNAPLTDCQLLLSIPPIIPASPSPALSAQIARNGGGPPLLDLAGGHALPASALAAPSSGRSANAQAKATSTKVGGSPALTGVARSPAAGPVNSAAALASALNAAGPSALPAAAAAGKRANKAPKAAAAAAPAAAAPAKGGAAPNKPPLRPAASPSSGPTPAPGAAPAAAPAAAAKPSTAYAARLGSKVGTKPAATAAAPAASGSTSPANATAAAPAAATTAAAATPVKASPSKKPRAHNNAAHHNTAAASSSSAAPAVSASPAKGGKPSWADMAKRAQTATPVKPAAAAATTPASTAAAAAPAATSPSAASAPAPAVTAN